MERYLKTSVLAILSVAVILASPFPSNSAVWTNLELYGGQVYEIAIDPVNPDKMFAGIYLGDGLYLSEDGGNTWQGVNSGGQLPGEDEFKDHAVWAVKIAQSDNNVIWVAHNCWVEKSMDGGQTWTHIFNSNMQRDCTDCGGSDDDMRFCRALAVDPLDAQTVYVGTSGADEAFGLTGAIYKTQDGGVTWKKINQGNDFDHTIMDIDIDPQNNNIIWAVTSSWGVGGWEGTLYRSEDGGETWTNIHTVAGGRVTVAVKPNDSNTVFTGGGWGLEKHYFDGTEWQYIWPLLPEDYPNYGCRQAWDIAFDPQNPEIIYVPWRNPWFGDYLPRVSRSIDGGDNWETYTVDYEFQCIKVHPADAEVLMGGGMALGMNRSQDHGQGWTPVNEGLNGVIVYDVQNDPNDSTHLLAGTLSGLFEKKQGQDWTQLLSYIVKSVEFDPADSQTFYSGLRTGWVAKTTDGGIIWDYRYLGSSIHDITIDITNTDTIYIAAAKEVDPGKIWKSIDGGDNYTEILLGENLSNEAYDFNVVTVDPLDSQHIFAGGGNFYAPKVFGDLWESPDGGDNWDRNPLSLNDIIVNDVLVDPVSADIIYAGCGYSGGTLVPLYKSIDKGVTWAESYEGIPDKAILLKNLWGSSGTDVFAVGSDGTVLHYDGNNWSSMTSGTTEHLNGVWGSSGTDVFAVGLNGTVLHYDGNNWSSMTSGTLEHLYDVWGSSGTDVFAVGYNGTVLHYDGINWSSMTSGTIEHLNGVWGSSETDVLAVGYSGTVLHYDGINWSAMTSGTMGYLGGVWGSSGTDVFAVGLNGTIIRYNGITWSDMGQDSKEQYLGMWGSSGSDVFVSGGFGSILHYNGSTWSFMRPEGSCDNAVVDMEFHNQNSNVLYAASFGAGVYLSPNQAGKWLNLGTPDHHVFAISTGSLYAATEDGVYQCTGTGVIAGDVTDAGDQSAIDGANVFNDLGATTISVNGEYMMVSPAAASCMVTAIKNGYANKSVDNVVLYGGDITWLNLAMEEGDPTPPPDGDGDGGGVSCFIKTAAIDFTGDEKRLMNTWPFINF
ncbi:MAG: hypothetical protein U9R43_02950 [Thermodesulfobacteriota bacterium]|nr:hypothetical protein [Thermodesulfobacteriota bacterium]